MAEGTQCLYLLSFINAKTRMKPLFMDHRHPSTNKRRFRQQNSRSNTTSQGRTVLYEKLAIFASFFSLGCRFVKMLLISQRRYSEPLCSRE